jgi:Lamin Tail Domain/Secretion system C-terminal sorting domain
MKKLYFLGLLLLAISSSNAQVVISQIYGGGGNAGATYTHDFVELFNRGTASVDISGYSIQYASAAGPTTTPPTWAVNAIPASTTIAPGKYFLIKLASNSVTVGVALPTPDLDITSSPINMSGSAGKVALVSSTTALSGANITSGYVDLVGFGTNATSYETAVFPAAGITAGMSIQRVNNGCTDANNNSTDFVSSTVNPRNVAVAAYSCTAPSISIVSPINSTIFSPETTSVSVTVNINNFTVANGSGTGHIHYTVNGGATVMKYDTAAISIPTTPGTYTIAMQLVDNTHAPLSPTASATVTFTVASYTVVTNLAALRADVVANGANKYYQVGTSPVITYARAASGRNQKYVQDATGGILIDDNAGTVTTTFAAGDSMVGLKGQATLFSSLLQFVPTVNATVGTSGNVVTPQVVTIPELNSSVTAATYESELVQINNVTFDVTTPNFPISASNINVSNGTDTLVFRSIFTEANYMGTIKPTTATNIIVLVGRAGAVAQVAARNLADITVLSANQFNEIAGLNVYPNPVSNGKLYITSENSNEKTVAVYDILGKQIINQIITNEVVNVSALNAGIYVIKITEDGKTATRKLVVR